jgi:hypothetical protein
MVCAVLGLYTLGWYRCPEIGTSSIDWAQLSRFYLKTETESSLQNVVFLNKNRMMDNVQKCNICIKQYVEKELFFLRVTRLHYWSHLFLCEFQA